MHAREGLNFPVNSSMIVSYLAYQFLFLLIVFNHLFSRREGFPIGLLSLSLAALGIVILIIFRSLFADISVIPLR